MQSYLVPTLRGFPVMAVSGRQAPFSVNGHGVTISRLVNISALAAVEAKHLRG